MVIDASPVIDAAWNDYESALSRLERAEIALDTFDKIDLLQFRQWASATSPDAWSRHEALETVCREKGELLDAAEAASVSGGIDLASAIAEILERRRRQQANGPQSADDGSVAVDSDGDPGDSDNIETFLAQLEKDFDDQLLGGASLRRERRARLEAEYRQKAEERSRKLKSQYRALARLLHPDMRRCDEQPGSRRQIESLWLAAQEAYRRRQPVVLQKLLDSSLIAVHGRKHEPPVSLLRMLTRETSRKFQFLKRKLNVHRRHPAWGFGRETDRAGFATRLGVWLELEINRLETRLARIENKLSKAARPIKCASRRHSNVRRRSRRVASV
jgi:hypothetical protein